MINTVAITGKVITARNCCESYSVGVIECNDEQFFILFDNIALPDPDKIKDKYVSINGVLQHFKHKWRRDDKYTIELGIFVRRLEVYDL
jgi:hypothetical protein